MQLSKFSNIIKSLFTDRMDIYRYEEQTNSDGTVAMNLSTTPKYTDVPCRISFNTTDNSETTKEDTNPIYLPIKIFCESDMGIIKGDKVVANRINSSGTVIATYKGTANLPLQYETHKEVMLTEVGDA